MAASPNVDVKLIEQMVRDALKNISHGPGASTSAETVSSGGTGASPRVERLKNAILSSVPEIDAERAVLVTKAYQETEHLPMIIRRAKALEKILNEMTIVIRDDELIVGNQTVKPRSAPVFPEFSCKWLLDELDSLPKRTGDVFLVSEETKATLREVLKYWDGKTVNEYAASLMPTPVKDAMNAGVFTVGNYFFNGVGHICVDYAKVLQKGFKGIAEEALEEAKKLDITNPDDHKKLQFLNAVVITSNAAINFAKRFAAEARRLAAIEKNPQRKAELEKIAENCEWVPANPARSFYEALQSFWFVQLIIQLESNGHSISPMRFDQYMYPYYAADIASGKITKEEAQELLDCLWVKFNDINKVRDEGSTKAFGGYPMFQNLIVGGQTPDGRDATNELSFMCLEATAHVRMPQPSISIRVWNKTPEELLLKAAEVSRIGLGMPAYYNDEVIIPALVNRGLTLEDARDYGIIGCVEPQKMGKTEGWHDAAFFNMAKVLELTIYNGECPNDCTKCSVKCSTKQLGPKTGEFTSFKTFDEFMEAFRQQMAYFVKLLVIADNAVDLAHAQKAPLPFLSSMVADCIKRGKSLGEGGAIYNFTGPQGVGVANVGDSLAALKYLVYEQKVISPVELKEALQKNFEGKEDLRQILLTRAPKYGNDDDSVDLLAREAALIYCREVEKYTNPRGGHFQPGLYPVSANVPLGAMTGATPDGRLAGTPLADGVSPASGRDLEGPTAAVTSVAKLDHHIASNGTLLNLKFHPAALAGESGLRNLASLVRTFFDQKGLHVQFNVVSKDTLLDAQRNPERYRSLVVRVAGYSAFFTALDKAIQDDIIARTEQSF
jgi:formate C-acetyltransferase